jgi:hypothetical protein
VDILHHLGQAAAMLLLLELLVVLIILLGIAGGLAFGLRWVNGKTDVAFDKVNSYAPRARTIVHRVTDVVALPVIKGYGFAARVDGVVQSIQQQIRTSRPVQAAPPASRPIQPAAEEQPTESVPLV